MNTHASSSLLPALPPDSRLDDQQLLTLLQSITGIAWEWYTGAPETVGGRWQLMPVTSEQDDFWWWHVSNNRQWFDTRHDAALSLIYCWNAWLRIVGEQAAEAGHVVTAGQAVS